MCGIAGQISADPNKIAANYSLLPNAEKALHAAGRTSGEYTCTAMRR